MGKAKGLVFSGEGLMKVFHLQFRKVKNTGDGRW